MAALPLALALAAFESNGARAHAVIEGISGFQGGVMHPLLVPPHLLCLAALGLLAGRQGGAGRKVMPIAFLLGFTAAIGLVVSAFAADDAGLVVLGTAAFAGAVLASGCRLPLALGAVLTAGGGLALALDSVPSIISPTETLFSLAGTALGAFLVFALVASLGAWPTKKWQQTGLRVLGSWIAAIAVLVLALRLH